jgi:hypothetical protein
MGRFLRFMFLKNKKICQFSLVFVLLAPTIFTKVHGQDVEAASTETLSPQQIASFKEQAIKSIFDLETYIQVVSDKKKSLYQRNMSFDLAIDLFQSDTVVVETSSIKSPVNHTYTIRLYLNKLKILPYTTIKMEWYKVYLASTFTLGKDGNYYGTATFLQRFEGKSNNEMGNYKDVTEKRIQIILKKVEAYNGAERINKFILKLGDIKVVETPHV